MTIRIIAVQDISLAHFVGNKGKSAYTEKSKRPKIQRELADFKNTQSYGQKICGIRGEIKKYKLGKDFDQLVDHMHGRL